MLVVVNPTGGVTLEHNEEHFGLTQICEGAGMRRIAFLLVAVVTLAIFIGYRVPASGQEAQNSAPVYVTEIPQGYRDWQWISSAHEAGNLNSLGAVLGNDVAIKAFREGTLPYPDGTIIAALHYRHVPSEENNKIFGQAQSFVPGSPTNIQFMVKDSKKYAATGGWGFGHFNPDGKAGDAAFMKSCFPCHAKAKGSDLVFTHYAR
jgi:Cytochrome P460